MQRDNPLFEDFARMMSGLAGTMAGAGREAETRMRERMREFVGGDFVTREEFEAVREMAASARAEVETLKAEIAALKPRRTSKSG